MLPVLMGFVVLLLSSSTEGWGLPFCPGSYNSTTWTDCFGTYTSADRIMYVGEWQNGKRRGQGTFTHWGGRIQEGIWENDNFKSPYPTTLESLIKTENDSLIHFKGHHWLVRQWLE